MMKFRHLFVSAIVGSLAYSAPVFGQSPGGGGCTISQSGSITLANGQTIQYTSWTIHSDGSVTYHTANGDYTIPAGPDDPFKMKQMMIEICGRG
jgi:hypothetical protein